MKNLREIKDLPIKKPTTEGINSWMLDQYFIAKSKEVNRFFGQFALLFKPAQPLRQALKARCGKSWRNVIQF